MPGAGMLRGDRESTADCGSILKTATLFPGMFAPGAILRQGDRQFRGTFPRLGFNRDPASAAVGANAVRRQCCPDRGSFPKRNDHG